MSKAIQGAAMLGGALAMATAAFFQPELVGSVIFDKIFESLLVGGIAMEAGAIASALTSNRGMAITIRQPAAYRQVIYGEQRVGGVSVYESTTGSHVDQYNYIIVIAGHEIDSIVNLYLDGRQVFWLGSGPGYSVRNGVGFGGVADNADHTGPGGQQYNFGGTGHSGIYCEARFGDQVEGDVMGSMNANDPTWGPQTTAGETWGGPVTSTNPPSTPCPWLGGVAYVYLKIEANADLFPNPPEIKFTVRGKNNIFDPRSNTYGYSTNWALIVADVLTDTQFGLGDLGSVNSDQLIAAANICDEQIPLADGSSEAQFCCHYHYDTAVSSGDVLATMMPAAAGRLSRIGGEWFIWPAYWQGPSFDFDESSLTGPLSWEPYRSLRELSNRVNGTYIAPNSPYNVAGNLYDSNGWYDGSLPNTFPFAFQPTNYPQYAQDPLHGYANDALLWADSGVQGAWDSGTTYDEGDVIEDSDVLYVSLNNNNTGNDPTAAPPAYSGSTTYALGFFVTSAGIVYSSRIAGNVGNTPASSPTDWEVQPAGAAWVVWVGNILPMEVTQSCCLSIAQAQRCAKIMLLRNRQQGKGTLSMHLEAWQMQPVDTFTFTFPAMGWAGKQLEAVQTRFRIEKGQGDQGDAQSVLFDVTVQETDQSTYEWSTSEELSPYDVPASPTTAPYTLTPPSALTLASSATTSITAVDGVVTPRILAAWTAPGDARVTQIQLQYQLVGAGSWTDAGAVDAGTVSAYLTGVIAGQSYNVQIRSLGNNGSTSVWVTTSAVTVVSPNSQQSSYTNNPQFALTQPTSTTIAVAAVAVTFGPATVNYTAQTITISAPGSPTWLYVTIPDATQQGGTITAVASASNSLVGVQGHTYLGAILALPAGSATQILPGGWPSPQSAQVVA